MKPIDTIPMPVTGQEAPDHSGVRAAYISAVKDYYTQLKAPYISSQAYIRQRLLAEGERLRECQAELILYVQDKRRIARLKEKASTHQSAIGEMEAGLIWAGSKIIDLDREMEGKILSASAADFTTPVWAHSARILHQASS